MTSIQSIMAASSDDFTGKEMARVLGIACCGYYHWQARPPDCGLVEELPQQGRADGVCAAMCDCLSSTGAGLAGTSLGPGQSAHMGWFRELCVRRRIWRSMGEVENEKIPARLTVS